MEAARRRRVRPDSPERLCRDALALGTPVFTLDSPDNAHLVALGAAPVSASDPAPLLAGGRLARTTVAGREIARGRQSREG